MFNIMGRWRTGVNPVRRRPYQTASGHVPALAAFIIWAARLTLALLDRAVTDLGGTYAMCDTNSMAIVATEKGGLAPCPGGSERVSRKDTIRALSWTEVEGIRQRFAQLNPYDPGKIGGSVLRLEDDNLGLGGRQHQLWYYAISAKRYCLYTLAELDELKLVKWSEHRPGHLLSPTDPDAEERDWMRQIREGIVRQALSTESSVSRSSTDCVRSHARCRSMAGVRGRRRPSSTARRPLILSFIVKSLHMSPLSINGQPCKDVTVSARLLSATKERAMPRWIVAVAALLAFLPVAATAQTTTPTTVPTPMPSATAAERSSCTDLDAYRETLDDAMEGVPLDILDELEGKDMTMIRPSQMKALSLTFDVIATRLEDIPDGEVPLVARDHHQALIDFSSLFASLFNATASGGPFAAMLYGDQIERVTSELDTAEAWVVFVCGEEPAGLPL